MATQYNITPCIETDCCEWNDFVLKHPQGHRMQTSCWAYTKIPSGWEIFLLTARQDDVLIGGSLLYRRKLPLFGYLVCLPKGPLCSDSGHDILPELELQARQWTKANHGFGLLVQPANQSQYLVDFLLSEKYSLIPDLNITPPGTVVIDLEPDEETLFMNLAKAKRKNIKRAKREGITTKVENKRECLEIFYPLYVNTSSYLKFEPDSKERFENIWDNLAPERHALFFTSYFDDQPLSSIMALSFCNSIICYRFGWSREYPDKRPNDYLHWEAIRWAKANDYRYFDFGEIHLDAARKISQTNIIPPEYIKSNVFFKLGFGGKAVLYPETYIYYKNPVLRWLFRTFISKLIDFPPVQMILSAVSG